MPVLFEPFEVGKLSLKNRFVRSATYYGLADEEGFINDQGIALKRRLAENEVGLIVSGYAFVSKSGQVPPDMNGIQSDDHIPGYRRLTEAIHEAGGKIVMQIVHGGAAAFQACRSGNDYLAVSLVDKMPDFGRWPREMNEVDILEIIEAFGQAAARVEAAGFDGVQIHGAHGYLVSQFLSPRTNRRTDCWGGSPENRCRFVLEVARSIKRNVSADFPVMVKLGVRDFLKPGDDLTWGADVGRRPGPEADAETPEAFGLTIEEGAQAARALEAEGISLVEISNGFLGTSSYKVHLGIKGAEKEAYFLNEARAVRQAIKGPLCLVAGLRSLPVMEQIVASGTADLMALSRPLIREPELIRRWKEGDVRPADCISCGGCFNRDEAGKMHIYCRVLKKRRHEAEGARREGEEKRNEEKR
jgi:2,4-dienoyl-CoA reductase-like NADH-dependent reductase (Old Yellow Enzyme family)